MRIILIIVLDRRPGKSEAMTVMPKLSLHFTGCMRIRELTDIRDWRIFLLMSAAGTILFFGRTAEYERGEEPGI